MTGTGGGSAIWLGSRRSGVSKYGWYLYMCDDMVVVVVAAATALVLVPQHSQNSKCISVLMSSM